jgi:hypothetical protein
MTSSIWDAKTTVPFGVVAFAARPSNVVSGAVAAKRVKSLRFNMFNPSRTGAGSGTNCGGQVTGSMRSCLIAAAVVAALRVAALLRLRDLAAVIRDCPDEP